MASEPAPPGAAGPAAQRPFGSVREALGTLQAELAGLRRGVTAGGVKPGAAPTSHEAPPLASQAEGGVSGDSGRALRLRARAAGSAGGFPRPGQGGSGFPRASARAPARVRARGGTRARAAARREATARPALAGAETGRADRLPEALREAASHAGAAAGPAGGAHPRVGGSAAPRLRKLLRPRPLPAALARRRPDSNGLHVGASRRARLPGERRRLRKGARAGLGGQDDGGTASGGKRDRPARRRREPGARAGLRAAEADEREARDPERPSGARGDRPRLRRAQQGARGPPLAQARPPGSAPFGIPRAVLVALPGSGVGRPGAGIDAREGGGCEPSSRGALERSDSVPRPGGRHLRKGAQRPPRAAAQSCSTAPASAAVQAQAAERPARARRAHRDRGPSRAARAHGRPARDQGRPAGRVSLGVRSRARRRLPQPQVAGRRLRPALWGKRPSELLRALRDARVFKQRLEKIFRSAEPLPPPALPPPPPPPLVVLVTVTYDHDPPPNRTSA